MAPNELSPVFTSHFYSKLFPYRKTSFAFYFCGSLSSSTFWDFLR